MKTALVSLSGGQDSVTALYWAMQRYERVQTVSFSYGQRHKLELEAASQVRSLVVAQLMERIQANPTLVAPIMGRHHLVDINLLRALKDSALTDSTPAPKFVADSSRDGLPTSFVPGRNLLFLAHLLPIALREKAEAIVLGVCQTDYSGYPDCREDFIAAMTNAMNLASRGVGEVKVETPMMYLTKAQEVQMAKELPGCMEALGLSVTCYNGKRPGCGECPACVLRERGFRDALTVDPARDPSARVKTLIQDYETTFAGIKRLAGLKSEAPSDPEPAK